jgi:hypothetical protein
MSTQVTVYIEATCTSGDAADVVQDALGDLGYSTTVVGQELASEEEEYRNLPSSGAESLGEPILDVFRQQDPEAQVRVVVTYIEQAPFDVFELGED